jgi:hypothetical protein
MGPKQCLLNTDVPRTLQSFDKVGGRKDCPKLFSFDWLIPLEPKFILLWRVKLPSSYWRELSRAKLSWAKLKPSHSSVCLELIQLWYPQTIPIEQTLKSQDPTLLCTHFLEFFESCSRKQNTGTSHQKEEELKKLEAREEAGIWRGEFLDWDRKAAIEKEVGSFYFQRKREIA